MNSSITSSANWTESGPRRRTGERADLPGGKPSFGEELIQCSFYVSLPLVLTLDVESQSRILLVFRHHSKAVLYQERCTGHTRP